MLHIKCSHCGETLKGIDVKVSTFLAHADGVQYRDYAVTCAKCGGSIEWDRYTQKAQENKLKALSKITIAPEIDKGIITYQAKKLQCTDQQVRDFYSAIIMRALKDYSDPKQKKNVEKFFASKYGKKICDNIDLSADFTLKRLKDGKIKFAGDEDDDL